MSCVVRWWDVLFVKGMHFSSKNARLLNFLIDIAAIFVMYIPRILSTKSAVMVDQFIQLLDQE